MAFLFVEEGVEFGSGAFPSVVAPEPVGRVAADGGFEHFNVALCELEFGEGARVVGEFDKGADIVASARSAQVNVIDGVIEDAGEAFSTGEDGCLGMAEKGGPVVHFFVARDLVGNEAGVADAAFLLPA